MKNPAEVGIAPGVMTAESLEHHYVVTEERNKIDMLRRVIRHYNPDKAIVFVNATDDIAEVEAKLNHLGLTAAALYGDADKVTRSNVLSRFREGKFRVLVASDVAARGLDIENLSLVVSFDPAFDSEHYVHRAGRTGRMGKRGLSVTIVTEQQTFIMRKFARELDIALEEREMVGGKVLAADEARNALNSGRGRNDSSGQRRDGASPRSSKPQARTSGNAVVQPSSASTGQQPVKRLATIQTSETSGEPQRDSQRSVNPSAGARGGATPARSKRSSNAEREKNRKNKGAPKWLKDKTPRGDGQ
jgi:superfamily II DNA/RNA helicase